MVETRGWENPEGAIDVHLQRARILADLAQADRGAADVDAAAALLPSMTARPQSQARLRAEVDAARAFLAGPGAVDAASRAIQYFERTVRIRLAELLLQRGRLYRDRQDLTKAAADFERGAEVLEDQRVSLRDEQLRVSRTAALWALFDELLTLRRDDPVGGLSVVERARARELLYSLLPDVRQTPRPVPELQRLMPTGVTALVYAQLPDSLIVWTVTQTHVEVVAHAASALDVARTVAQFTQELQTGSGGPAGQRLVDWLMPGSLRLHPDEPLVIVPDGPLHHVAFAALPIGRGQRLVERAIPVVTPSLTTFVEASRRVAARPATAKLVAVGFGGPVPDAGLPRLPHVDDEIRAIASLYAAPRTLTGDAATVAQVAAQVIGASVLHVSGHSATDEEYPAQSRIFLAEGSRWLSTDMTRLTLMRGGTVVLATCGSATGPVQAGEGPMSIARSFLAAGAGNVVAALWPVRDEETTLLLVALHESLSRHQPADRSLAAAQRRLIAAQSPPRVWASFVSIGGS